MDANEALAILRTTEVQAYREGAQAWRMYTTNPNAPARAAACDALADELEKMAVLRPLLDRLAEAGPPHTYSGALDALDRIVNAWRAE